MLRPRPKLSSVKLVSQVTGHSSLFPSSPPPRRLPATDHQSEKAWQFSFLSLPHVYVVLPYDHMLTPLLDRSTTVTIQNGSLKQLLYDSQSLQHGEFGSSPPTIIPAGAGNGVDYGVSSFEAESDGFATGDEGTVTYRYDDGTTFALYFDNPQTTGNVYGCNIGGTNPKDYTCTFGDGSGNNADITFTIQPVASKREWSVCLSACPACSHVVSKA